MILTPDRLRKPQLGNIYFRHLLRLQAVFLSKFTVEVGEICNLSCIHRDNASLDGQQSLRRSLIAVRLTRILTSPQ